MIPGLRSLRSITRGYYLPPLRGSLTPLIHADSRYCLLYTTRLVAHLPFESFPVVVTVRVLPLAETTMRPVKVTLPSFLAVNANVWLFIFRYERMSEVASPVTA